MPRPVPVTGSPVPASQLKVGRIYDVYVKFERLYGGIASEYQGRGKYAGKDGPLMWLFKSFIEADGSPSAQPVKVIVTETPVFIPVDPAALNISVAPSKSIPAGSEDAITREDIKNGDNMIDFDNEASFNRYYLETTYSQLNGKNPFTNNTINTSTVQHYTAKITAGGKRRKKTLRRRKTRKTKKASK